MAVAAFMLAHQVAGKAARDALFLAEFGARDLPKIVAVAALTAIALSLLFSRGLARFGPRVAVPLAFLLSAALHAGEWLLIDRFAKPVVIGAYLHIVGLGAILLSGFWALASEMFDPREAKVHFGRIAGVGTAGGIAGGLLAERTGAWFSTDAILVLLAGLHAACGALLWVMRHSGGESHREHAAPEKIPSRRAVFQGAPYLVSLAGLVLIGTTTAAMLDYLFKSGAAATYGGRSPELLRYFALFYTGAQVLTFVAQTVLSRYALQKLGLARTIASLPVAVAAGSGAALLLPVFGAIASVRALELILRGSLFRAGYELFYTPVAPREKRAVKVLIDVGCDRLGDAIGAGIVQGAIWLGPSLARPELLSVSILLAGAATWIATRLDKAYTSVLEKGLIDRAVELDFRDVHDSTTMTVLMRTLSLPRAETPQPPPVASPAATPGGDPLAALFASLRSGDARRVRTALTNELCEDPALAPLLIRLLAWDEVCEPVLARLASSAPRIIGQLSDALLDERQEFAIRRRIPRLLVRAAPSPRAVAALLEALNDSRFEVRFQSARALDAIRQRHPEIDVPERLILAVVEKELSVSRTIWEGHRLLDRRETSGLESTDGFSFLDEVLRERANASLEHVFSLLAVVLPREPLKVAFRALHTDDRSLRALGLEYLESVLPAGVRDRLWPVIEDTPATAVQRPPREVLDQLMLSSETLQLKVRDIRDAGAA